MSNYDKYLEILNNGKAKSGSHTGGTVPLGSGAGHKTNQTLEPSTNAKMIGWGLGGAPGVGDA